METTLKHRTAIGLKAKSAIAQDSNQLELAVKRAQIHLPELQHFDGFWLGELEANSTLCADYLAFMHWSGEVDPDLQNKCIEHLLARQSADGGWSTYNGGPARLDPSVKAYFALKLAGIIRLDPGMRRAATLIRELGGLEKNPLLYPLLPGALGANTLE
jgi:squalene-hopene/tetraprenyl-beta-curcumene cyclase